MKQAAPAQADASGRRLALEITLIARPGGASRPTLGRLRTLVTRRSRTVVVDLPEEPGEAPRPTDLTHWRQLR